MSHIDNDSCIAGSASLAPIAVSKTSAHGIDVDLERLGSNETRFLVHPSRSRIKIFGDL